MSKEKIELLGNLPFLAGADPAMVQFLAQQVIEKCFQPGEIILEEDSFGQEMYLLVEGCAEVLKGQGEQQMVLGTRCVGDLFGEMALIEGCPRFATIRATEFTRLLEFSGEMMRSVLEQQPELLFRTVQVLSGRLRESDLQMITDLQQKNLELAQAYRELQDAQAALLEKERMEKELQLAREIQQSILPDEFPALPGFDCAARSQPARQVGGDFYDVIQLDEQQVALVMADVSDKGMPAALFMALARSLIRAEARRSSDPKEVLENVHQLLMEMNRAGQFVTIFYGVLDLANGTLNYVRAGHDEPLYYCPSNGDCQYLESGGMLLGLLDPVRLEEMGVKMRPDDLLVLYTDGITDAQSPAGDFFGRERLQQAVCDANHQSAQTLCDFIFARVEEFQADAPQFDDAALLVVHLDSSNVN